MWEDGVPLLLDDGADPVRTVLHPGGHPVNSTRPSKQTKSHSRLGSTKGPRSLLRHYYDSWTHR